MLCTRGTMLMHMPCMHTRTPAMHTPCAHPCNAYTLQEQLEALAEAYADPEAVKMGSSDDEGDAEID